MSHSTVDMHVVQKDELSWEMGACFYIKKKEFGSIKDETIYFNDLPNGLRVAYKFQSSVIIYQK